MVDVDFRAGTAWPDVAHRPEIVFFAEADDPETARSRLGEAIDKFLRGLYAHLDGWELSMLRAAAERIGDEWIEREFRARELWNLAGGVTVSDVELGEHGLQNTFKIGGKVIKLSARIPSITTTDEFTVLRFFDSSPPNLREIQDVPEDNEDAFLYGLYLMAQYHLERHSPMVEIDGMNGQRVLAGFAPTVDGLARRPAEGLNVHRVADRPVVFFKNVKARLKQAVVVLEAADMEARPGRHCEFCTYGELCRVSSQFGEQTDPFEGEKR
ncbi:MAG: PD-(D/E)XK nuclease family protein [Armatimonadetes bacterium]|nr:PD-(D/E)XK nuclease family protein [Armatimonadota bacterium]